jgi:hypothetical protein
MITATDTPAETSVGPSRLADRIGRTLLALCAAATLVAFADGITRVAEAPDEWLLTEFWRTAAYLVFAGLWAFLAAAPRKQRGMWELLLLHKIIVTVQALVVIDAPGAVTTAWIDGVVSAATLAAYFLCHGWLAWRLR